nr:retrovirus-related Pol polyprotein from transposon TNT 1-94 [Tanacetum cinerariifolium]
MLSAEVEYVATAGCYAQVLWIKSLLADYDVLYDKSAKKQSSVAMLSAEVEYVAAAGCYAQVLWIKSQLADYDVLYDKFRSSKFNILIIKEV